MCVYNYVQRSSEKWEVGGGVSGRRWEHPLIKWIILIWQKTLILGTARLTSVWQYMAFLGISVAEAAPSPKRISKCSLNFWMRLLLRTFPRYTYIESFLIWTAKFPFKGKLLSLNLIDIISIGSSKNGFNSCSFFKPSHRSHIKVFSSRIF